MNEVIKKWQLNLEDSLDSLKEKNLYRRLQETNNIDFSSNDYLSLNSDGTIDSILKKIINHKQNRASTGSRLIKGHHVIFDKAEEFFSEFVKSESSLLFHSGYAANLGAIPALISHRDLIFCDRLCHASLLDGIRLSGARRFYFKHNDLVDLQNKLERYKCKGNRWIITESIFSMDADKPDLKEITKIAHTHNCLIYLDEAHSIGILGKNGNGLTCELSLQEKIAVRVFPLGKAPGFMGAFVSGNSMVKKALINKARSFIYSTAQPAFMAEAILKIMQKMTSSVFENKRKQIKKNAEHVRTALKEAGYDTYNSSTQIIPVLFKDEKNCLEFQNFSQNRGIDVRAIRPPTVPKNSSRIRICMQSDHTSKEIEKLIDLFIDFKNLGLLS